MPESETEAETETDSQHQVVDFLQLVLSLNKKESNDVTEIVDQFS